MIFICIGICKANTYILDQTTSYFAMSRIAKTSLIPFFDEEKRYHLLELEDFNNEKDLKQMIQDDLISNSIHGVMVHDRETEGQWNKFLKRDQPGSHIPGYHIPHHDVRRVRILRGNSGKMYPIFIEDIDENGKVTGYYHPNPSLIPPAIQQDKSYLWPMHPLYTHDTLTSRNADTIQPKTYTPQIPKPHYMLPARLRPFSIYT